MRNSGINTSIKTNSRQFTLIEVLVSISILAMGLTVSMFVSTNATQQQRKAQEDWGTARVYANIAEFYLLFGEDSAPPSDIYPENNWSSSCTFEYVEDGEPTFAFEDETLNGKWRLGKYTITVYGPDGSELITKSIEKVVYNED